MTSASPFGSALRNLREEDQPAVIDAVTRWWNMPNTSHLPLLLPRLFFQHFTDTSWVLEGPSGELTAFLVGFRSQSHPLVAYVHFVGVDPALRRGGTARALYDHFFAQMRALGCSEVHCITGPSNTGSQAFHTALGFTVAGPLEDYDGPGQTRMTFVRSIGEGT